MTLLILQPSRFPTKLWCSRSFVPGVGSIVFEPGASSCNFTVYEGQFALSGVGISNNSGTLQNFDINWICFSCGVGYPNTIEFYNTATAGELTSFTLEPPISSETFAGQLVFWDSSNAGSAVINNLGSNVSSYSAETYFFDTSSAENAMVINGGSSASYAPGRVSFYGTSTAGHATIINNGALSPDGDGGLTWFQESSDSGDSTIICNGDSVGSERPANVLFHSTHGRPRIILHGNGQMHVAGGYYHVKTSIGSLEGDGDVFLGDTKKGEIVIGTSNRSTIFTGVIQGNGAVTKFGNGALTLAGSNTFSKGTIIESGQLKINNATGSGTGTGPVQVNGGTLSGRGTIAGAVIVGSGTGAGAVLAPGDVRVATLTIQSAITFNADANYSYNINTKKTQADELVANGVTINAAALFSVSASGHSELPIGTTFTAINNTAATPISGAFSNLADGSTITAGANTFQASYEGGDGNDLTLTVVP